MGRKEWMSAGYPAPIPLVEIAGERRVLIEHHLGVCSYTGEQVQIRVRFGEVHVYGSKLCIARMTGEQLVICGTIDRVDLVRNGGKHGR